MYQLVHFCQRRGRYLRAPEMLTLATVLSDMRHDDPMAWKQLNVRVQERAIDLELEEMEKLVQCFQKVGRSNSRIESLTSLFLQVKADNSRYGPS